MLIRFDPQDESISIIDLPRNLKRHKINKIAQIGPVCYALTQGKHIKVERITQLEDVPDYEHCEIMINKTYKCLQEYSVAAHGRRKLFTTGGKVNE